jgi:hypothetical protein
MTYAQAMRYVGVKRRMFDTHWKPRLPCIAQGTSRIYDINDLDALYDEFKAQAVSAACASHQAQNSARNERPNPKGAKPWADTNAESTANPRGRGESTSSTGGKDFFAALKAVRRPKAG